MSKVQLSDAIIPTVYESYQSVDNYELTAFYNSGIIVQSPLLNQLANGGGKLIHLPYWKDLDQTDEPNISDDTDNEAVPGKLGSDEMVARTAQLNNGWSAADLVSELAGSDPMTRIAARTSVYWSRQWQRRLIAAALGVYAENVASGGGDMVQNFAIEDGVNSGELNLFGRQAFTAAIFTLGDAFGQLSGIAVHSIVFKRMVDNDDITVVKDSTGTIDIPTYMGKRVIVDDSMPVVAGVTSGFKYTSILFGSGAFGYGVGKARVPVEVEREAAKGNGGGVETLWERKTWLIHPFGYKWNEANVAGVSPTLAELKLAANWTRKLPRKNVPLAFLVTNG
jgi:hypothetical protein